MGKEMYEHIPLDIPDFDTSEYGRIDTKERQYDSLWCNKQEN